MTNYRVNEFNRIASEYKGRDSAVILQALRVAIEGARERNIIYQTTDAELESLARDISFGVTMRFS